MYEAQLREVVMEVGMKAALGDLDWRTRPLTERLAICEERLLARLGVEDFRVVSETGSTFLSWLRGRKEITAALFRADQEAEDALGASKRDSGVDVGLPCLRLEADSIRQQAQELSPMSLTADDLGSLLATHWRLASPGALESLARSVVDQGRAETGWGGGTVVFACAALFEPGLVGPPTAAWPVPATRGHCETVARRALAAAPALEELGSWLRWDAAFAPVLGDLADFLRKAAPALGLLIFDLGARRFVAVRSSAATSRAWEASLREKPSAARLPSEASGAPVAGGSRDARAAAEALMAHIHTSGWRGVSNTPGFWRAYAELVVLGAESGGAEEKRRAALFVASLLASLPLLFRHSPQLLRRLLLPLAKPPLARELLWAASELGSDCQAALHVAGLQLHVKLWIDALQGHLAGSSADRPRVGLAPSSKACLPRPPPEIGSAVLKYEAEVSCVAGAVAEFAAEVRPSADFLWGLLSPPKSKAKSPSASAPSVSAPKSSTLAARNQCARAASDAFPGGAEAARALIEHIRAEEFGIDGLTEGGDSPAARLAVRHNARLSRALTRLGEQLYADSCHWQFELLQNADDCDYDAGIEPTVEFTLGPGAQIVVCSNERGLMPDDIRSMCDIGSSTKPLRRLAGHAATGEKGLGFKAVFAISDKPRIASGPVSFGFDSNHPSGLGYVLPEWISDANDSESDEQSKQWTTKLTLPLRDSFVPRRAELFSRLGSLPSATLLFLRRVQRVVVARRGDDELNEDGVAVDVDRTELALEHPRSYCDDDEEVTVDVMEGGAQRRERWLVLRHKVDVPLGVDRPCGMGDEATVLEAAVPLAADGSLDVKRGPQHIFAHLPVGPPLGAVFALQGDWALASSREALLEGHPWNELLLAALPELLLRLLEVAKRRGGLLAKGYLGAMPDPAAMQSPFRLPMVQLGQRLRACQCVLTARGNWVEPQHALLIAHAGEARELLESEVSPLLRSAPPGKELIDAEVERRVPKGLLESLGCEELTARHVLHILETWSPVLPYLPQGKEAAWWPHFLALIDALLDNACASGDEARLVEALRRVPFLPLAGGRVAACAEGLCLPPDASAGLIDADEIPRPLSAALRVVSPALICYEAHDGKSDLIAARAKRALRRLGVESLTVRRIVVELVLPFFSSAAAAVRARGDTLPAILPMHCVEQTLEVQLAIAEFAGKHWSELIAGELGEVPVAWPLASSIGEPVGEIAVGMPHRTPPLHLPSVQLGSILAGSRVHMCLPWLPEGAAGVETMAMLRRAGLALPVLRVRYDDSTGDWLCPEFDMLSPPEASTQRADHVESARLRNLALAFDEHWEVYRQFGANSACSEPSAFLRALRHRPWMAMANSVLRPPADLWFQTPALASALPKGTLDDLPCCAVPLRNASFREVIGLGQEPNASLALALLRVWSSCGRAGAAPGSVASLYALVETAGEAGREGSDSRGEKSATDGRSVMRALRAFASVVVATCAPLRLPSECVWEDEVGCNEATVVLAPIYGPRWRSFFVDGLGVPKEPSLSHCIVALQDLAEVNASMKTSQDPALHRLLLHMSEGAARGMWTSEAIGEALRSCRAFPLAPPMCGLGAPADDLYWLDDCPDAPPDWLEVHLSGALVATPDIVSDATSRSSWRLLLDAVGIHAVSVACTFRGTCCGAVEDTALTVDVLELLLLAERYLYTRQPQVHTDLKKDAARFVRIQVLVAVEVFIECTLVGNSVTLWPREVAVREESCLELLVRRGRDTPWPALCIALARALLPPGPEHGRAACREGLATFLLSAHAREAVAGNEDIAASRAAELCDTFQLPEVPAAEAWKHPAVKDEAVEAEREWYLAAAQDPEVAGDTGTAMPALADPYGGSVANPSEVVKLEPDKLVHYAPRGYSAEGLARCRVGGVGGGSGGIALPWTRAPWARDPSPSAKRPRHGASGDQPGSGRVLWSEAGEPGSLGDPMRRSSAVDTAPWPSDVPRVLGAGSFVGMDRTFVASLVDISGSSWREAKAGQPPLAAAGVEHSENADRDRCAVGRWGERFVYNYLKSVLGRRGCISAGAKVRWVNEASESGLSYDICVDDASGVTIKYVEVKATRGSGQHAFEVSHAEWAFAQQHGSQYAIYRVHNAGSSSISLSIVPDPHHQWCERRIGVWLSF